MKTMSYKPPFFALFALLLLSGCDSYRTPTVSQDATKMSDQTLCYRAQTTGKTALKDAVRKRNLDCRALLESDPLLNQQRY